MRRSLLLATMLLLGGLARAQLPLPEEPYWTPDAALIARLEAGLKISSSPDQTQYKLPQYDRYYYGATIRDQRIVRGVLILPPNREDHPKTGVHITEREYMPRLHGGGCAHVFVTYSVKNDSSSGECDMLDTNAPPSEQPHWKPDEQTAARMEALIQDRMHHAGLADLSSYGRYYVGVTIDGKRMIRGRIERSGSVNDPPAGVHLVSEPDDLPIVLDGGCSNIRSTYDVNAERFTELTCNEQGGSGVLKPQG